MYYNLLVSVVNPEVNQDRCSDFVPWIKIQNYP